MNNLDELFRKKLAPCAEAPEAFEQRHPFEESYWKAAEKLIEQQQRRRWFILFLFVGGIGAVGSLLYVQGLQLQPALDTVPVPQVSLRHDAASGVTKPATDFSKPAHVSADPSPAEMTGTARATPGNFSAAATPQPTQKGHSLPQVSSPLHSSNLLNSEATLPQTASAQTAAATEHDNLSEYSEALIPDTSAYLKSNQLHQPAEQRPPASIFDDKPMKNKEKVWQIGAALGLMWQPRLAPSSASIGVWVSAKVRPHLLMFAESHLRVRFDRGPESRSEQIRYGFGRTNTRYMLQRTRCYWWEFPLGIQFFRQKWSAEGGIAPAFLLGQSGSFQTQTSQTPGPSVVATELKHVWLDDTAHYQNLYLALFAGIQHSLHRNLSWRVRTQFLLNNLEKNSTATGIRTPQIGFDTQIKFNF